MEIILASAEETFNLNVPSLSLTLTFPFLSATVQFWSSGKIVIPEKDIIPLHTITGIMHLWLLFIGHQDQF